MPTNISFEIKRKIFHIFALLYIAIYILVANYYDEQMAVLALLAILMFFIVLEFIRINFNVKVPIFNSLWRDREKNKIGGEIYFLIGAIIAFAVFDFNIALAVMLMTIFGDMTAALIGVFFGKKKIHSKSEKTWEGFFAELIVNIIVVLLLIDSFAIGLSMAFTAAFVETIFTHIDDNLAVPVTAGFVGQILTRFI